ncbi:alpha/beta hydrolase-fold protein [Ancylothrix sp. C2]|uniref:alpha/beta hydrolase-fold protein n=1 Tax=Ancylothrix sp. D3o TaxID=2953691 RepID=UPI0021BB4FDD|nr:alpha/beta hydrolase-fold protein [Ancylothrix sp. D3o]MCT7950361.1 alpha/beta hydrolase-fold protein [Ancylothrix sp. D3o]
MSTSIWTLFFLLPLVLVTASCSESKPPNFQENTFAKAENTLSPITTETTMAEPQKIELLNAKPGWNKNLSVDGVSYDIYVPQKYRNRSVLVLPGWNYPRTSWPENSNLVNLAEKHGYVLILPEMLQTLYESSYYPDTQLKWNQKPGGEFIKTRLIPEIQKRHNLLRPGQNNTLLGLSTGGRGVALIALENPRLFVAGASLSGDFSQENTPDDRLMTAVYGAYTKFPERWKGRDNPSLRAAEWVMPLYLAHGTADDIVPEQQSRLFYQELIKNKSNLVVEYHAVKDAGHDYQFWGGQLPAVFGFFEKVVDS